jgi:hypothetical protein
MPGRGSIEEEEELLIAHTQTPFLSSLAPSKTVRTSATRGRCYDQNFLRFSSIFGKKLACFSKTNVMIKLLHNLALFCVKNANFFSEFFSKNI